MNSFTFLRRRGVPGGDPEALASLADGSLSHPERVKLEARMAASPELAALLEEQKQSLSIVRRAAAEVAAPPSLRSRLEAAPTRRRPRTLVLSLGAGVAVAAALTSSIALIGGGASQDVAAAAEFATRTAGGRPPAPRADQPSLLARSVGGVSFPNWRNGWKVTGARSDRVGNHLTSTVFYENDGRRVGYTIVDGALQVPRATTLVERGGTAFRTFVANGRLVVTWERRGRTCVLSGSGVGRRVLLGLAAWKPKPKRGGLA